MDAEFQDLQRRALANDPRALTIVGRRLLSGDGIEAQPHWAVDCLNAARRLGDSEASTVLAGVAAHGLLEARNLTKALDLLLEGAERGWTPALEELRFLARAGGDDATALGRAIDLPALTRPPPSRALSDEPRIRAFNDFATPAECDWLIGRVSGALKPATIYHDIGDERRSDTRTNTECDLSFNAFDVVTAIVLERVAAASGVTRSFCEVPKVLHYESGEEFTLHRDFYDLETHREEIAQRGQRIATFLVYLSDDYEGGETDFPKAGVRYKGGKGDALLFVNVGDDGAPDPMTHHAGLPPTRGEKWLLSQWVRGKAINAFMTPGEERERLDPAWRRKI